jgi:hypothetical protein
MLADSAQPANCLQLGSTRKDVNLTVGNLGDSDGTIGLNFLVDLHGSPVSLSGGVLPLPIAN